MGMRSRSAGAASLPALLALLPPACGPAPDGARAVPDAGPAAAQAGASKAWRPSAADWIEQDQRQPQPAPLGFRLHAGELHARRDSFGMELGEQGWRFDLHAAPAVPEVAGSRVVYAPRATGLHVDSAPARGYQSRP